MHLLSLSYIRSLDGLQQNLGPLRPLANLFPTAAHVRHDRVNERERVNQPLCPVLAGGYFRLHIHQSLKVVTL